MLGLMAYITWKGSQPSKFFAEEMETTYVLKLPENEITAYYDLKDRLAAQVDGEGGEDEGRAVQAQPEGEGNAQDDSWMRELPQEKRRLLQNALMLRLISDLDCLNQVQRDKPSNWKLWRAKLVSEQFWNSLCEAEKIVSEEIDSCLAESEVFTPGMKDQYLQQAIQLWRMQKERAMDQERKADAIAKEKQAKVDEEKQKEDAKRAEIRQRVAEARQAEKLMEQLIREEELSKTKKKEKEPKAPVSGKAGKKKKMKLRQG